MEKKKKNLQRDGRKDGAAGGKESRLRQATGEMAAVGALEIA